jgi:hypothetical protein
MLKRMVVLLGVSALLVLTLALPALALPDSAQGDSGGCDSSDQFAFPVNSEGRFCGNPNTIEQGAPLPSCTGYYSSARTDFFACRIE